MSNTRYFKCVVDSSHIIAMDLTEKAYKVYVRKFKHGRAVCPNCKPENHQMVPCDPPETENCFGGGHTLTACRHGHTTKVSAFANGMLHVKWGDDNGQFENIKSIPEEIAELVDTKAISCNHTIERKQRGWGRCGCKLKIVAGEAEVPQAIFIKTKTRVGDVWDKQGIVRPSEGTVAKDGTYRPGALERRHNERLREIKGGSIKVYNDKTGKWKRQRRERNAKPKGGNNPTTRREENPSVSRRQAKKSE